MFQKVAIACLILTLTALAASAAPRTFVSTDGNDTNSCGRNQPCRTFTAALAAVDANGEIVVLDSGGYGAVTISKAVRIIAPDGVHAAINATSGSAVIIAAGVNDLVELRGLTLNGGLNNPGIDFNSGESLFIRNCALNNFANAVVFDAAGKLFVEDTTFQYNSIGIFADVNSGIAQVVVNRVSAEDGNYGIYIGANTKAVVSDSIASHNNFSGFTVTRNGVLTIDHSTAAHNGQTGFLSQGGLTAILNADYCTATNNGNAGFSAGGGSNVTVRVSNSTATDNAIGFDKQNVSIFESYGNNRVRGNMTNTYGAITTVSQN